MKRFSSDWYWYYVINYTLVILIVFPIYWTFISSVKTPAELITSDPTYFPQTWTWKYYYQIWNYDLSWYGSPTPREFFQPCTQWDGGLARFIAEAASLRVHSGATCHSIPM